MSQEKKLNPMALSVEEAAKTLGIPREWVDEDVAAGAPTNADGTLSVGVPDAPQWTEEESRCGDTLLTMFGRDRGRLVGHLYLGSEADG